MAFCGICLLLHFLFLWSTFVIYPCFSLFFLFYSIRYIMKA